MEFPTLVKGGTVIDGSGAPAYMADVRVACGQILEIGRDLAPAPVGEEERQNVIDILNYFGDFPGRPDAHDYTLGPAQVERVQCLDEAHGSAVA